MAEVFEARRAGDPQRLVVKVLLPQHAEDPVFMRMLEREAELNAALQHPNLVRVLELGTADGCTFLVMELVDGLSLDELVAHLPEKRLSVGLALLIIEELLEALAHVHQAMDGDGKPLCIVHRDVTPQNVLIDRSGHVRLGDFGIARSELHETRTRTNVIKGKVRYLSPEQAACTTLDARSDLYNVGLIAFELIAGEPYLCGATEIELLKVAAAPPPRTLSSVLAVEPRIDELVGVALGRSPDDRHADARVFLDAVRATRLAMHPATGREELAGLVERAMLADAVERRHLRNKRRTQRLTVPHRPHRTPNRRLVGSIVGVVLAGMAGAALMWARSSDEEVVPTSSSTTTVGPSVVALPDSASDRPSFAAAPDAASSQPLAVATPDASSVVATPTKPIDARLASEVSRALGDAAVTDAPAEVVGLPDANDDREILKRQLAGLRHDLLARGLFVDDLADTQQAMFRAVEQNLAGGALDLAASTLRALEIEIARVSIDAALVKRKLDRATGMIRSADPRRVDRKALDELASRALQDYLDGRYEATNRHLNDIRRLVQASGP